MNKKAIAIDVIKHPIIKKLLESKIATTSTINKLIVQEMMNEAPSKLSSKLKNIAVTIPSTVIKAASTLDTSPNGDQVGPEEKVTLEFSDKYEKVLGGLIQSFIRITDPDKAKMFFIPELKEATFKFIDRIFEMFEGEELQAYQEEGIGKILLDLKNKIAELTTDSAGGLSADAKDAKPLLIDVFNLIEQLRTSYSQYMNNKPKEEEVAKAMKQAAGGQPGEQGQEGEGKKDEPVTTQLVNDEEGKKKLKQQQNSDELIDNQAQADKKNFPNQSDQIDAAAEELKDEMAEPEDEIPDDVRKLDLVKVFEEENLESSFEYFLDTFVSARYFDDQARAINDVMKALEAFETALKSGKVKQSSLQENKEPKEIPPTILKQLTEKKKEMIEPLKKIAQLLKNFKQKQDLFSRERKDMVIEEADKLQVVLRDVKVLLLKTKFALPTSEPQALQEQTKQEKIDNIKKVYAKVRPSMITISKLIRNFKDPKDDSKVSVSQVLKSMRAIKKELETVSPYFSRKQTSFTKDKITFGNLAGLIKRFANEIADIIDNLNEVIGTGDLSRQDTKGIVDKINELEDDIEKFIGAKKQPMPSEAKTAEAELDDDEEEEGEEEQEAEEEQVEQISKEDLKEAYGPMLGKLLNFSENIAEIGEDEFYNNLALIFLENEPIDLELRTRPPKPKEETTPQEEEGGDSASKPEEVSENKLSEFETDKRIAIEYIKRMNKAFKAVENSEDPEEIKKQIKQFREDYKGLEAISDNEARKPSLLRLIIFNFLKNFNIKKGYSNEDDLKSYYRKLTAIILAIKNKNKEYFEFEDPKKKGKSTITRLKFKKQMFEHKEKNLQFIELQYKPDDEKQDAKFGTILLRLVFEGKTLSLGYKMTSVKNKEEREKFEILKLSQVSTKYRDFNLKTNEKSFNDIFASLKTNLKPVAKGIFGKTMKAIKAPFVDILEEDLAKILEPIIETHLKRIQNG